jgi:hypothetical protein
MTLGFKCAAKFALSLGLTVVIAGCDRNDSQANWRTTEGRVEKTVIRADHGLETKWGSEVVWQAEFEVLYIVDGQQFITHADSGVRGQSGDEVRLVLLQKHPRCTVSYHPGAPELATAKCYEGNS